jgi:hypothetical protein
MKVTFIGHASILIDLDDVRIVSDPWWRGPCFGAQWWQYPTPHLKVLKERPIDYIYISHGHHDHYHPGTLKSLSRDAKVLVSKGIGLADSIRQLGYYIIPVAEDEECILGSHSKCRIMETAGGDTLMAVTDGRETCVNLNDALHSAAETVQNRFVDRLRDLYGPVDYVFCGYGVASHFPNCYVIPGKDRERTAAARQSYFNRQWARIIHKLGPRFGFPFAADVVFLEDKLFWVNEVTHNSGRPTEVFRRLYPESSTQLFDIAPGFTIADGNVVTMKLRTDLSPEALLEDYKVLIERANRSLGVDSASVQVVADLLAQNVETCLAYLSTFEGNYRFLIEFRGASVGIEIRKIGERIVVEPVLGVTGERHYDVVYTTRLPYLRLSLTTEYGHELLFVGSGGIFEYRDRTLVATNMHHELMTMLKKQVVCPPPRHGGSGKFIHQAKKTLRSILGLREQDSYDLEAWTVFHP